MRLCVNNRTVDGAVCEQQGYANETKESSKRKWKNVMEQMVTKMEQGKKIVTMPVYGNDPIPRYLSFTQTLDTFNSYYVNKYIDHHAFEIAF